MLRSIKDLMNSRKPLKGTQDMANGLNHSKRYEGVTTMTIIAQETGGKDFKKVPPGCHFAICNMVVDLGVQETTFKGQAKQQHKVYIRWEVPDERVTYEKDGEQVEGPCSIGSTYTLSLSEKAKLRQLLQDWRGKLFTKEELKGFDITSIAGKPCQVMVQHSTGSDGKTYANVTGVMGCSKEQRERAKNARSEIGVVIYSLDDQDADVFEQLPKWIKEKLANRVPPVTVKTAASTPEADDDFDDPIPF